MTQKISRAFQARENQKRAAKGMVTATLNDNHGLSQTAEVAIWIVAALVIGSFCFVAAKKIFPDIFTSIGTKFTEMLNQWKITTP